MEWLPISYENARKGSVPFLHCGFEKNYWKNNCLRIEIAQ